MKKAKLFTIGYEGRDINNLVSNLKKFNITRLIDVREIPISRKKGWKLNEYGLFGEDSMIVCKTEQDIYDVLGLGYIPPELREDNGEIEASQERMLPELIKTDDIKGVFHVHTNFSDGVDSIERLRNEARKMGYTYIGIADHSRSAYYAGGLKIDDIYRQWEIIDRLNEESNDFYIFKGIESDILPDGSLDYEDGILKGFDFVIASIHSSFSLSQEAQEKRILRAMENPCTTMIGHPTGRLLLSRDGYSVDMRHIIEGAAMNNVIIELNASRYRLDIDWRYLKYTKEKGVVISINPDAHAAADLYETVYGVGIARKGWQEKKDVFNTCTADEVMNIFKNKKT